MTTPQHRHMICKVCGDPGAQGFHYSVVACEPCKVFFRRWAPVESTLICASKTGCEGITMKNRANCRKCRLKKCYSVGMDSSGFLNTPNAVVKRNRKPCRNSTSPMNSLLSSSNNTSVDSSPNQIDCTEFKWSPIKMEPCKVEKSPQSALMQYSKCRCDCQCGRYSSGVSSATIVENSNFMMDLTREQYTFPLSDMTGTSYSGRPLPHWWLVDGNLLSELDRAHQWLIHPGRPHMPLTNEESDMTDLSRRQDRTYDKIIRVLEVVKQLTMFRELDMTDQTILFKTGCFQILSVIYIINFDPDTEEIDITTFTGHPQKMTFDILKRVDLSAFQFYHSLLTTFDPMMIKDVNLIIIFYFISFFNPTRKNLTNPTKVGEIRDHFQNVLKRHIQHCYDNTDRYMYVYRVIMAKIEQLDEVMALSVPHLVNMLKPLKRHEIDPLIWEMFGELVV